LRAAMTALIRRAAGTLAAAGGAGLVYWSVALDDTQRTALSFEAFSRAMPLARLVDAESAHRLAVAALAARVAPKETRLDAPELSTTLFGRHLSNPLGLAAGFDKGAEAIPALFGLGFGLVEVGSITPKPQDGNPKPRVFRLTEHRAIINRYGFNSDGCAAAARRLATFRAENSLATATTAGATTTTTTSSTSTSTSSSLLGVNLGKNKLSTDSAADYAAGTEALAFFADYLVINVSSPNTPGLRGLQESAELTKLVRAVKDTLRTLEKDRGVQWVNGCPPPVVVKLAPDLNGEEIRNIARAAMRSGVDGLIVSNTTVSRPGGIADHERASEAGGLSGPPLMDLSTQTLREVYRATGGKIPIIGVGGVSSGRDAYRKIRAGASVVQLYTAFAYEGPALVPAIKEELAACLRSDGYESVADAVGADYREKKSGGRRRRST